MPDDRVAEAAAELYGTDPARFTGRRKELADAARAAGDRDTAKRVTSLRKPTRAAWAVNMLARADRDAPDRLAALAAELSEAAGSRDGRRLRELSARRGALIDELTARALVSAGIEDPSVALRDEVADTLTSALADPDTADQFGAGTLTRAAQWAGFGIFPIPDVPDVPGEPGPRPAPAKKPGPKAAPSQAEADSELTAWRRKKALHEAERRVASASDAAAAAGAAEEALEAEVHSLEDRLTQARAELADARGRARRAETAERKARQALDRLPPA
ncbi:MAG TPA: hypothetical protein VGG75_15320 [Trebonia sp.]